MNIKNLNIILYYLLYFNTKLCKMAGSFPVGWFPQNSAVTPIQFPVGSVAALSEAKNRVGGERAPLQRVRACAYNGDGRCVNCENGHAQQCEYGDNGLCTICTNKHKQPPTPPPTPPS
jgi:hypothetical protein